MKRVILQLFAVALCMAVGQALRCYKCKIGFWNVCITTEKTCEAEEHCFSGIGKAAGFMDIKTKGCLAQAECNKTEQVSFNAVGQNATLYTMTKTCCSTELCNAAPGLPGASGISLAFASITALLMANFLV
ncbi:sperm acrosome membrane-associated protein 4-like [Cynoglossus semilaevis]|uniref:Lymphocyte antigen-6, epidermis n=1 Tax=Cynoglossus semilaevis TaxID=244447 RepID=A0A3P8VT74_CYNSE|nr:sperm acrosome membrane-associated protein 4-like [Cynoglossus semilaevis]